MQGFRFLLAALQFNFVLLLCYGWGSSPAPRKSQFYMMSSRPSYKDMLKNAQLAKAAQRQNSPTTSNDDRPTAAAISVQPIQEAEEFDDNSDDKSNTNGLPFTDEVYDHLKFVIEKLSGRMRTPRPLSPEDFARFEKSVRAIIYDAVGSKATPQPTVSKTGAVSISSPPQSGKSTPFDEFKGKMSTWNVPGMESMSTEEYYRAVNSRLNKIRDARKSSDEYERESSKNYIESLARKENRD